MSAIILVLAPAVIAAIVPLLGVLRADGHGHNPPPRSHRGEEPLTQHARLRRLAR